MKKVYGYARVSTAKQNIDRQIENILREYPAAVIYKEAFTGTTTSRPEWNKLLKKVRAGDIIVFDEVSRMSRNAAEGFELYSALFRKGVQLVFLKEPHINTAVYESALKEKIGNTGNEIVDPFINALNEVLQILQRQQIEIAFQTAQKEVDMLHRRTAEGIRQAKAAGKVVGRRQGAEIETKKAKEKKAIILRHSIDFGGSLTDKDCITLTGLSRNTFYKYKKELRGI